MLPFKEPSSNSLIGSQMEVSFLLSPGILLSLSKKESQKISACCWSKVQSWNWQRSFGSWIELCWQAEERFAWCNCLLLAELCGKLLVLTNSCFAHSFEVKRQERRRKNST